MKNFICFLLFFFIQNSISGQNFTDSEIIYLTISADFNNAEVYETLPLVINNTEDVLINGNFTSEIEVTISPIPNTTIHIVPTPLSGYKVLETNSSCCTTVIRTSTGGPGIINPKQFPKIKSYPNPVCDILTFNLQDKKAIGYSIFDISGNQITHSKITPTNEHKIDVSDFYSGNYILNIELENGKIARVTFIKK